MAGAHVGGGYFPSCQITWIVPLRILKMPDLSKRLRVSWIFKYGRGREEEGVCVCMQIVLWVIYRGWNVILGEILTYILEIYCCKLLKSFYDSFQQFSNVRRFDLFNLFNVKLF